MVIKKQIALDFGRDTIPITVFAKQFDKDSRVIELIPLASGKSLELDDDTTAKLKLVKADGKAVISPCTIADGKISVELSEQCLTAAGTAKAEIALYKDNTLLSSQVFYIDVKKSAFDEAEAAESNNDFKDIIMEISELKARLESTDSLITYPRKEPVSAEELSQNIVKEDEIFRVDLSNSRPEAGEITVDFVLKCGKCRISEDTDEIIFDEYFCRPFPEMKKTPEALKTAPDVPDLFLADGVSVDKVFVLDGENKAIDLELLQYAAGTLKSFIILNYADYDYEKQTALFKASVAFKFSDAEQAEAATEILVYLLYMSRGLILKYKKIANVQTAEVLL